MARRIAGAGHTKESRQAEKIAKLLTEDFAMDLERVGYYLVRNLPRIVYHRLDVISLSAQEEFEKLEKEMGR